MKILFITPHLSTGGGPQYLLKKIVELKNHHDVYCVEYEDVTGGVFVVQRNKVKEILNTKLITLGDNKYELINHIKNINPDVIHFEELPEYFCDVNIAEKIYVSNRLYKIIETSHDSSFDINTKQFFPDRFVFVSIYQKKMFAPLKIESDVVEYPIEYKTKSDRIGSLQVLGLDPNLTHFVNVGLFTPRKNQAEIIEYARRLTDQPVQFHFVGNQAGNFHHYWEPLIKNLPNNCKIWGERKDVDSFYNSMDVFLFTSKGTVRDKETSPLVIREAIGWNITSLLYNLPVYCGMYDKYPNLNWLTPNFESNLKLIKDRIKNYNINIPVDLKMNVSFQEPNIINISTPLGCNGYISVRDNLTNVPLYYCHLDMQKNCGWNIMPIGGEINFKTESYFSEFLLEFYDNDKQFIESYTLKVRELDYVPVSVNKNFSPFDCLYINYKQMFYEDIYSHCCLDDLETVIDLGANVGLFSLYMLKKRNCKRIYAVEPTKKAFSQLSESLHDEPNSSIHKLAIHNFDGKSKIKSVEDNSTISGFIDDVHPYTHHNMKEEEVDVVTLSRFMNDHNLDHVDLIKIDIEGSEYDVIDSLSDFDLLKSDRYLIEYHWAKTKNIKKIVDRFKFLGFNILNNEDPTFDNDLGFFFAYKNK
jgi:FkbM family methyltransferase